MKNHRSFLYFSCVAVLTAISLTAFNATYQQDGYIFERENSIKKTEPGPHNGGGSTTAFSFFDKGKDVKLAFRKRILHKGSSIGYHLQETQEVYYILTGKGILTMNGKEIPVQPGDAILTMPGSSHGLKPADNKDLTVLITYEK
ncbi:MAG TPA: cupin domain-containing protein [Pedobacter sp.]|jgi:quercetin dioxygenase-like cupin family protein